MKPYSYPETTAPSFAKWRGIGAKTLLTGFVQAGDDGRLTVGCYIYDVGMGDVVYVDLPEVGAALTVGQAFGTIESVKAVSELFAPVSGTVTEVNASLKDRPDAVNSAPHDSWMIKVQLANPGDVDALLDAGAYEALTQ